MRSFIKSLLLVPRIRYWVGYTRFLWLTRIQRRPIQQLNSGDAFPVTLSHNLAAFKNIRYDFLMGRMDKIIFPLSQIEQLDPAIARVLVIGPRTENDILRLMGLGFRRSQIEAIDLISYSDWIKLGDLHHIPYDDNTFDAVICGWTISYSSEPQKCLDEMIRVARPGGILGIGFDHVQMTEEEKLRTYGYSIETPNFKRINTLEQLRQLCGASWGEVYFSHDAPGKSRPLTRIDYPQSCVVAIFSVQK